MERKIMDGKVVEGKFLDRCQVAVVGGGLSGWIAACLVARGGLSTVLFEKADTFGGRARTVTEQGVAMNLGAHTVFRNGELFVALWELNIPIPGTVPPLTGHGLMNGKAYALPTTPGGLAISPLFGLRGKVDMARLMMALKKSDTRHLPSGSFREWVDANTADSMVRALIDALARTATYFPHPEQQAAGPVIRQLKYVLNGGTLYVEGGWGSLVDGLRDTASRWGVRAYSGTPVERVHVGPPFAIGLSNGEVVHADHVILAVPPEHAYHLLAGEHSPSLAAWRDQARPFTVACLDLALRRLPRPEFGFVMGMDEPVLLADQCRGLTNQSRGARPEPGGLHLVHLLKYHGSTPSDVQNHRENSRNDRAELEAVMDRLQPGWREEVEVSRFLPRMTVMYDFDHVDRSVPPGPRVPEIEGLYVAGDWAGHGELLADAAAASAKRAVEAVLADRSHKRKVPAVECPSRVHHV